MGEGFQFIDIVLFAMIAAFLILRLRSVLGRHRDHGRPEDGVRSSRSPQRDDNVISLPEQVETTPAVDDRLDEPNRLQKKLPLMPGLPKFRLQPQILTEQSFLKARARLLN